MISPADRLKRTRHRRGMSVERLHELTGLARSTIRAHETGQNGIRPEPAAHYAAALGVQPEFILFGVSGSPHPEDVNIRMVPLMGELQAGAWHESFEADNPTMIAFSDEAYTGANHVYALTVRGPSFNLEYPEGTVVIVVDALETSVHNHDHVIVKRKRGPLVETSLREVMIGLRSRIELWPRSTDGNHQEPLIMTRGGAEIVGVVISAILRRPPRSGISIL